MPRRQRALARLSARVRDGAFSTTTLSHYLLPMLRHLVLRDSAKEIDVAEEAVHVLREVAAQLPWRPYLSTLQVRMPPGNRREVTVAQPTRNPTRDPTRKSQRMPQRMPQPQAPRHAPL